MGNWTQGNVDSAGVNIHYHRTGSGKLPPLVLCHGFSDNGLCWTRVAKHLEDRFDIIMVDARNHGESGHGPADLRAMTNDLALLIEALDLRQPVALGHSMGASMVADLAARFPDRVSHILLEDPPWTLADGEEGTEGNEEDPEQRSAGFKQFRASARRMTDAELIAYCKQQSPTWHAEDLPAWAASKKQVSEGAMDGLNLRQWSSTVVQLKCPTLLIYADEGIVNHEVAEQVRSLNPLVAVRHIENAGHNIRREQFADYMAAVESRLPGTNTG